MEKNYNSTKNNSPEIITRTTTLWIIVLTCFQDTFTRLSTLHALTNTKTPPIFTPFI